MKTRNEPETRQLLSTSTPVIRPLVFTQISGISSDGRLKHFVGIFTRRSTRLIYRQTAFDCHVLRTHRSPTNQEFYTKPCQFCLNFVCLVSVNSGHYLVDSSNAPTSSHEMICNLPTHMKRPRFPFMGHVIEGRVNYRPAVKTALGK